MLYVLGIAGTWNKEPEEMKVMLSVVFKTD